MNKQFIPYKLALEFKELGFDEECFGCFIYYGKKKGHVLIRSIYPSILEQGIKAPLWQQAFDWFRETFGLMCNITFRDNVFKFNYGFMTSAVNLYTTEFKTYEEARQSCLNKLIEIVNEQTTKRS